MKKFILSLFLFMATAQIHGYNFTIPADSKHAGTCYYNGLILKKGDNSIPSTCQNVHCNEDGSMLVEVCGHFEMRDCHVVDPVNLHKPYPECCRMNFVCTNENGEVIHKEVSPLNHTVQN